MAATTRMSLDAYRACIPVGSRMVPPYECSEADWQAYVIDYARAHGWLTAHIRDSRGQDVDGVPDLVLARNGLVILAELKSQTGAVRKAQKPWLAASGNHLWRPVDKAAVELMLR